MTGAMEENKKKRDNQCCGIGGRRKVFFFEYSVIWQGLADKMTFEQTLERTKECAMHISRGSLFLTENTASAKSLSQECCWSEILCLKNKNRNNNSGASDPVGF